MITRAADTSSLCVCRAAYFGARLAVAAVAAGLTTVTSKHLQHHRRHDTSTFNALRSLVRAIESLYSIPFELFSSSPAIVVSSSRLVLLTIIVVDKSNRPLPS